MNTSTERRQHSRFPANHLKVLVKSLRNQNSDWGFGAISMVDFNRYGIGLETAENYAIGDILSLVIRTDDSTLAEVNGLVCNRTLIKDGFRFGIRFEHQACEEEESPEAVINISEEILMIERHAAGVLH
ncbi:MAG: PilZ domain-containing protein [Pseudomonadales bacterium]